MTMTDPTRVTWHRDERVPTDELLARQLALLSAQVRQARQGPYYREQFRGHADTLTFADLATYSAAVPAITKDEIITLQRAEPPYGGLLAVPESALARHYVYPAGQVVTWTHEDHRRLEEMYAAGMYTTGIRDTDRVDITFQYAWVVAGTIWDAGARRLGAAVAPGGAGESNRHAANMRLLRTTCLIGFSTFLERIAESAVEAGLDPATDLTVQKMIIVGEWHGSDTKGRLAELYGGASVREAYGTGETGLVAAECEADPETMHVHPDVLLEVRHELTGELVADGQGGELFLTPLYVEGMPVLRFRTGDITAVVRHAPCACGRTTPRIGRIVGRVGNLLRVKGMFLSPTVIRSVLDGIGGLGGFHVTVDRPAGRDRLVLRVEAPHAPQGLADEIVLRIRQRTAVTVEVDVVGPGAAGTPGRWFTDDRA